MFNNEIKYKEFIKKCTLSATKAKKRSLNISTTLNRINVLDVLILFTKLGLTWKKLYTLKKFFWG